MDLIHRLNCCTAGALYHYFHSKSRKNMSFFNKFFQDYVDETTFFLYNDLDIEYAFVEKSDPLEML